METIHINKVEEVTTQTGKTYLKVEDINGNLFGCWDLKLKDDLLAGIGKVYGCTIETRGNFKNIKTLGSEVTEAVQSAPKVEASPNTQTVGFLTAHACNNVFPALLENNKIETADLDEVMAIAVKLTVNAHNKVKELL